MAGILTIHNEWRDSLRLASYRGIYFHVETSARQSGRRTVTHQYPKRNTPYAEDMGREAVHWSFTGYILLNDKRLHLSATDGQNTKAPYADLIAHKNALLVALEQDGPGELVHPSMSFGFQGGVEGSSLGGPMLCMCERYSISESRQKGGYYEFDMQFVEAGTMPMPAGVDSRQLLQDAAVAMDQAAKDALKQQLGVGFRPLPGTRGPAQIRPRPSLPIFLPPQAPVPPIVLPP